MYKFLSITLLCLFISTIVNSQVITFEGNDTLYLKKEMKFDNFSPGIWVFKDHLPPGKYYQIRKHDCGTDTLRQAEFSKKGVKDGLWIEWNESLCLAIDDESISTHTFTKAEVYKGREILYNEGFILKSVLYQTQNDLPLWELSYPPNTIDERLWNISRVYKDNYLSSETRIIKDSISNKITDCTTTYNEKGFKIFTDKHPVDNEKEGSITFYQDKNRVLTKGKYVISSNDNFEDTFHHYTLIGSWPYYNELNEHIVTLKYKKGRLSKIKYLASDVNEYEILNWLNSFN
ncbi:hypothetical protein [Roseivirga seohaensis]|uniref:hypothetical protein n=1 Tax=Roseivirga seohaensis TaxID=1914963 RepID=UPI003BA91D58